MAGAPEAKLFFGTYIRIEDMVFAKNQQLTVVDMDDLDEVELMMNARIEAYEDRLDELGCTAIQFEQDGVGVMLTNSISECLGGVRPCTTQVIDAGDLQRIEEALQILGLANPADSKYYLSAYTDY